MPLGPGTVRNLIRTLKNTEHRYLRAFGLLPPIHSKPSVAKAPSVTQLIGLLVVVVLVSFLVLHFVVVVVVFCVAGRW